MTLPYDVRRNATWIGVERAKASIRDLAANRKTIGLICGGAGIGKNTLTRQIAKQHLIKYVPEDRPDNAAALVSCTWRNVMCPLHVLNECDHLLRDPQAMNIIKLMHETPRRCAHYTNEARRNEDYLENGSRQYRESIAPTSFALDDPVKRTRNARQLFTLNLNYTDPEVTRLLPQEHWTALLRRGLDPVFIPTPDRALFEYVVWLGGEGRMLNNRQFDYPTSRDAIAFYVQNVNRLPELSPGRLVWIAEIIRDYPKDADMLDRMLSVTDQRDLGPEPSLVQVLLWPRRPPKRRPGPARRQDAPPRAPQQATAAPELTPEPKPIDEPAVADPEPPRTVEEAINLLYGRRQAETCVSVAEALHAVPMQDWEPEEFDRLKEALDGAADWFGDHNDMAHTLFSFETSPILFGTSNGVLIYEDGLRVLTWPEAMERIAPEVEAAKRKRELERRQQEMQRIMRTKLPEKRKLKAMKSLLDEVTALQPTTVRPDVERGFDFIRAMSKDDERFAECGTFEDYMNKAAEITAPPEPPPPAPSGSDQPRELIEPDAAPTNDDPAASADAILAVDLGRDVETRKGAFFSAMQTAADKGVLPDDLAALLPFIREILTHGPDQTRRFFG
ncbi:MAG: hypothetical protein ACLPKW_33555, partial [Acetobacteraceae bacterium]